jgi:hypothetical protein
MTERWYAQAQAGDQARRDNETQPRWAVLGGPYTTKRRAKERCKTAVVDMARVGKRVQEFRLVREDGAVDEVCRPPPNGRMRWTSP